MTGLIRILLALSVAAMGWWAFAWPFVVSTDGDDPRFRLGSIATLLLFFGCIVELLITRIRSRDTGRD